MIVPMVAPTLGAALLAHGGWRIVHAALVGIVLLLAVSLRFTESALRPKQPHGSTGHCPQLSSRADAPYLSRLHSG
jgi:hypothetical protein